MNHRRPTRRHKSVPRECAMCGNTFMATTRRRTCGSACFSRLLTVSAASARPSGSRRGSGAVGFRRWHVDAARSAGARSIMIENRMTVDDPAALIAAGVRLVDSRGQIWVPLELAP